MYDSVQHFNEFGVKNIEKIIKNFIKEKMVEKYMT